MFLVEGLPAILLGFVVLFVLCDSPAKLLVEPGRA